MKKPMFEAEPLEFPAFADLPKREKSKIQKVWDAFQELSQVTEKTGMLIPQAFAAKILDVSRQRVHQMIATGLLESYDFNGVPFVTENSVVAYAKSERKSGRPWGKKATFGDCLEVGKQLVKKK